MMVNNQVLVFSQLLSSSPFEKILQPLIGTPQLEPYKLCHCPKRKDLFETLPASITEHKIPHLKDFTISLQISIFLLRTNPIHNLKISHTISIYSPPLNYSVTLFGPCL